jgi:putative endonuclease
MFARLIFAYVKFVARRGLVTIDSQESRKERARKTGVRGETYAYWYLRRHGYILMARNYTLPGIKGEIDMIGLDGPVLAFVEVKTRDATRPDAPDPERAVDIEKRHHLARMARQFRRSRRMESAPWRFDVIAIETRPGKRPELRLHKGAFVPD